MMKYDRYQKFRQQTYQMLGKAKDATFELMDSVAISPTFFALLILLVIYFTLEDF